MINTLGGRISDGSFHHIVHQRRTTMENARLHQYDHQPHQTIDHRALIGSTGQPLLHAQNHNHFPGHLYTGHKPVTSPPTQPPRPTIQRNHHHECQIIESFTMNITTPLTLTLISITYTCKHKCRDKGSVFFY